MGGNVINTDGSDGEYAAMYKSIPLKPEDNVLIGIPRGA